MEAVNQLTLYLRSIVNVYEVFEPLHMLWIGIWVHPYTVPLAKLAQMLVIWISMATINDGMMTLLRL